MQHLNNQQFFKPVRKYLRNHGTSAEASLWKILKKKQVGNYKFRRQHSIGKYILDFYCPELKLAIELDGQPHAELVNLTKDTQRDKWLNNLGIVVFRYENRWVFEYPDIIKQEIIDFGKDKSSALG